MIFFLCSKGSHDRELKMTSLLHFAPFQSCAASSLKGPCIVQLLVQDFYQLLWISFDSIRAKPGQSGVEPNEVRKKYYALAICFPKDEVWTGVNLSQSRDPRQCVLRDQIRTVSSPLWPSDDAPGRSGLFSITLIWAFKGYQSSQSTS